MLVLMLADVADIGYIGTASGPVVML